MPPKKIAIYSGEIPSTTFIERLIEGLAYDGFQIYLFGNQSKKISYSQNVVVHSYSNRITKLFTLVKYSLLLLLFKASEKRYLDKIIGAQHGSKSLLMLRYYPVLYYKPDIFHLQWAKNIADWMWVQDFGIKIILSLRGTHMTISPIADTALAAQFRSCFSKIDGFHAVSHCIKNEAIRYGGAPSKIEVVYSGLDIQKLPFSMLDTHNKTLKIVSIGRSHWVKGYNYAIEACNLLKNELFDFHYTIVGIDKDEELLFQRAQLELEQEIFFKKNMSFQNIIEVIQESDILLLSSVEEGIANVVLEAMAMGTIVLSTNCGGMDEVITDGENGFLVPVRNPQAIAAKIQLIAALSVDEKQFIRIKAREFIEKQHNDKQMIYGMKDLYNSVLEINE